MATDNVISFRGSDGSGPPPRAPIEPMGPRLAAFFIRGASERLDRLQSTLNLLHETLKATDEDVPFVSSLADLCADEAGNIQAGFLLPIAKGLEANCEQEGEPEDGKPTA